jgi:hypothetical protein
MFRRTVALAAGAVLAAALAFAAAWPARATTGTCLGTQNPVSGPVSCGGLFLPKMNPAGGVQPNTGTLSLTTPPSDYWNAPLSFDLYSPSDSRQDFTVYERCTAAGPVGTRTEANPCGTGGTPVLNAASGEPEFVTEVTPLGKHLGGALNTIGNLCVSWEALPIGPHHRFRFAMVERTCNTFGATFYAGIDDGIFPNPPYSNTGVTGIVVSPNLFQTFAAVPGNGGDLIANDALSNNFHNLLYVVDDRAFGYPSGAAILYPENDGANQIASFLGCNGAVLTTGVSFTCP